MITSLYIGSIMTKSANFDWSCVDRDLLAQMIRFGESAIVGKSLHPLAFSEKIRKIFRLFGVPVNVRSHYNKETKPNNVWIGGLYEGLKDKNDQCAITIITQFHQKDRTVKISKDFFRRMCYTIADTVLHEVIHLRQYRRRKFKNIPGFMSTASSGRKRAQQDYLGHPDEIDAYSFNIACQLYDRFKGDQKQIVNYLNKDLSDRRTKKDSYKTFLDTFDHNHEHTVIRKLKKKVVNYLPNAGIGKPYKTTDWLRK